MEGNNGSNSNKMSTGTMATIAICGFFVLIALICGGSYVSNANYGNRAEVGLEATWTNNENILGNYTLKIQEAAAVPEMYKNDLKEVVTAALSSRYGADGSKATFQWIKEHNIAFDSKLYGKIQQLVEAGRNEFQAAQTRMIDEKRVYQVALGNVWSGMWLSMAGYPKVNLAKYKPVLAGDTARAFETGVAAPVQMRAPSAPQVPAKK